MGTETTCPRCRLSPLDEPGASRATGDRDIDVCGACCSDEAWLEHRGHAVPMMATWPVTRTYDEFGQTLRVID